jgi:hypothetical protein
MKTIRFFLTQLAVVIILLCFSKVNFAQDTLVRKSNKGIIVCKVIEIGLDEIKYKDWNNQNGPDIVISKNDLIRIKFQNGTKMLIAPDDLSLELDSNVVARTNDIKFHFFAPLANYLCFGYETALKHRTNLEVNLGIIGVGAHSNYTTDERIYGGFLQVGSKFYLGEDFYVRGQKRVHPLKGKYFKIELTYVNYTRQYNGQIYNYNAAPTPVIVKTNINAAAINLIYGRQYLLGERFTFEYYVGAGFGVQSAKDNSTSNLNDFKDYYNCYGYEYFGSSVPLTITGGITLGYIFK